LPTGKTVLVAVEIVELGDFDPLREQAARGNGQKDSGQQVNAVDPPTVPVTGDHRFAEQGCRDTEAGAPVVAPV
jgi:hypothetical protein